MKYQIAMDSSANLLSMEGVPFASVPLKIVTDQREFVDEPGLNLDAMLEYLAAYKGRSGTSCPNVGDWLAAFGGADRVFAVTITSALSGCCNAALQARDVYEEEHPGRRVCVLDSLSTGPEMALIAEKLRELIGSGKDFDTIETEIRAYMTHTHLMFTLESLNNMARNGRVSPLIAKACGLLGIRILGQASTEGTLQPLHKCRGEAKALKKLVEEMKKAGYRGGRVRVVHCKNPQAAEELAAQLREEFPGCDLTVGSTTALCSFYAERGGILVGFEDY